MGGSDVTGLRKRKLSNYNKIQVVNNCGSDSVVVCSVGGGEAQECTPTVIQQATGNINFSVTGGTSFNKYVNNNFGGATLAEIDPSSEFINLSKIKGFNAGVQIKGEGSDPWKLTCLDVNCPDAYFLCDNAEGNPMFSPNSNKFPFQDKVVVTFCPDPNTETNSNHFASDNHCGFVSNKVHNPTAGTAYVCTDWGGAVPTGNSPRWCAEGFCDHVECPGGTLSGNTCRSVSRAHGDVTTKADCKQYL